MDEKKYRTQMLKGIVAPALYRANSFVAENCRGNPAGICLLPAERDASFYVDIAVKMGCPETAFVYQKDGVFQLRWFTRSGVEVSLCGHATLAASWILGSKGYIADGTVIHYNTRSGILSAQLKDGAVVLDFPLRKVTRLEKDEYHLAGILGLELKYLGKSRNNLLAEVAGEDDVKKLKPDFSKLVKIPVHGFIITARSDDKKYDFVSRFFAPSIGIDEDPVTGSAHCVLADYWSNVLKKKCMTGHQVSAEGGVVGVTIKKDRVLLSGRVQELPVSVKLKREIGRVNEQRALL